MISWDQTSGALLRQGTAATRALATVPGRGDGRPRAEQYPDVAAAHRAAWGTSRWAYEARDPETGTVTTQFADNAEVRAVQQQLAEQGAPLGWCDFPDLGYPPPELRPLYAAAIAQRGRVGMVGPDGVPDDEMRRMIAEADYARTPYARRDGRES